MVSESESKKYKLFHEQFMQNLEGTTFTDTFMAIMPLFLSVFLITFFSMVHSSLQCLRFSAFCFDFLMTVFMPVLCFTLISNSIHLVFFMLCIVSLVVLFHHVNYHRDIYFKGGWTDLWSTCIIVHKKPYITNFRAFTNVLSAICILAVDFKSFPRRFAKTETFGYSLMDTGVGLFCVANAIVSPEVLQHGESTYRKFYQAFLKSFKNCIPLLIIGMIRFYTTKETDYHVHVSEYGVHWNFFITLAVTKLFSSLLLAIFDVRYSLILSLIMIGIHESILQYELQEWVLSDIPRDTFFSANREGVVSSLGYVSLYLSGVYVGYMLKSTKVIFKDMAIKELKLISLSVFLWTSVSLTQDCLPTSRRLANAGYFLWILTFSITVLTVFLFLELFMRALYIKRKNNVLNEVYVPVLMEAINYNGLGFFLLANLGTGVVNLCFRTLFIGSIFSVVIVTIYMLTVCFCTYILFIKGYKLKL